MALFRSAYDALTFAYCFNGDNCTTAMLGIPPQGNGRGLGGLNGAAEVGNIKRIVHGLGEVAEAYITARFTPARIPCSCHRPCCQGWTYHPEWYKSIVRMAREINQPCFAGAGRIRYRWKITAQYFLKPQERESLTSIAAQFGIHHTTAGRHFKAVVSLFRGTKRRKGMEQTFIDAVEEQLSKAEIIGDVDDGC